MGENTKIEWAEHTFNPWRGCTKVSEGCENCYAARFSKRNPKNLGVWGDDGTRVVASYAMWKEPFRWNSIAESQGVRHRVFCASFADVFEDWKGMMLAPDGCTVWVCPLCSAVMTGAKPEVQKSGPTCSSCQVRTFPYLMSDLRARFFRMVDATPNLDWLLVTKRPENIRRLMPVREVNSQESADLWNTYGELYRPNVWLLASVENQEQADKRIPELLKSRELAPVLGLSCEPLLGPVDLIDPMSKYLLSLHGITTQTKIVSMTGPSPIDWVICGGESGDNVRPMHPDWARSLRDQCQAHGVPFFFKQWGEYCSEDAFPGFSGPVAKRPWNDDMTVVFHVGKKLAGRLLDGVEWNEFPQRMESW